MPPDIRRPLRRLLLATAVAGLMIPLITAARTSLAKEFEMQATIECGLASGQPCPPTDFLTVWTVAISGTREQYLIDVSWIRAQLEQAGQKQDDLLCLLVEEVPGVGYRGLGVRDRCEDEVPVENEEKDKRKERDREGEAA